MRWCTTNYSQLSLLHDTVLTSKLSSAFPATKKITSAMSSASLYKEVASPLVPSCKSVFTWGTKTTSRPSADHLLLSTQRPVPAMTVSNCLSSTSVLRRKCWHAKTPVAPSQVAPLRLRSAYLFFQRLDEHKICCVVYAEGIKIQYSSRP
jgi:hypothetical protein